MKETTKYLQKKVLVLGLAKSGVSAASLLNKTWCIRNGE